MATTSRGYRSPYAAIRRTNGKRSGLEAEVAAQLDTLVGRENYQYEREIGTVAFTDPRNRKYLPDFKLPSGIIVEVKGWFKTEDRRKHLLLKQQHPDLDIRFVFSNPNQKIGRGSATTYAMWCEKNGFQYAKERIPEAWLYEN